MNKKLRHGELEQRDDDHSEEIQKRPSPLKHSKEKFKFILDEIDEGYVEVALSGHPTFVNDSFCKITGYSGDELFGFSYRKYMDEETARYVYQAYNKVYTTGVSNKGITYEIICKDGTRKIVENSISLMRDSEGHRRGFWSIFHDITDRKRAEEELAKHRSRLEAIFRSVIDAVITVDNEMMVIEANMATENICGIPAKETTGKLFINWPFSCTKSCQEVLSEALQRKTTIKEYRIECGRQNRPQQIVILNASPLLDQHGKFTGAVLVIRDITKLSGLERELRDRHQFHNVIGKSKKMQDIYGLLEDLSDLETTVLITGESGTGKDLIAKALHYSGCRASKPLVTVNCSALAESLLESELFGHVKGSFTGAIRDKKGRFQAANGGTILLDEIGDISPRIQLELLRVLEEKEFERVGESIPIKVDIRVIASTNRNLREKVKMGEFREDLYYRLKVLEIAIPPLRERIEDIPLLVDHFLNSFNKSFKKNIESLSGDAVKTFINYPWPGNVRELEHVIEHAFVLCRGQTITIDHLPLEIKEFSRKKRDNIEKSFFEGPQDILGALNKTGWNKSKAARLLGLNRRTVYRRIYKHKLKKSDENM